MPRSKQNKEIKTNEPNNNNKRSCELRKRESLKDTTNMLDEMRHFKYITKVKLGKEYWFRGNQWLLSFNREQMAPPGCNKKRNAML